jgi:hypothetical protein
VQIRQVNRKHSTVLEVESAKKVRERGKNRLARFDFMCQGGRAKGGALVTYRLPLIASSMAVASRYLGVHVRN